MATLADLKTRIVTEMSRDDLSGDLAAQLLLHIQRACEFFADERFWFNAIVTTVATTANAAEVTIPATVRTVDGVTIPALNVTLQALPLDEIEALQTQAGQPRAYAYYNDQLTLYPTPGSVYTLRITGTKQIDAPAVDADTSVWTNEAQDLICGRASYTLYRSQFRDPEGAALALGATQEARDRILRETTKRLKVPLRSPPDAPWAAPNEYTFRNLLS